MMLFSAITPFCSPDNPDYPDDPDDPDCPHINYGVISFLVSELYIVYSGSETYLDNQCIVSADNDYINLHTGQVIFRQDDMQTGSTAFPFLISHFYDINRRYESGRYGHGWKLSVEQSVELTSGEYIWANYTDEGGKKHYFTYDGKDTEGLNLDLSYVSGSYKITDRTGIRKVYVFDEVGRAELVYEDVPVDGSISRSQVTGTAVYQYADHKRSFSSSVRAVGEEYNLVRNGSFEKDISDGSWSIVDSPDAGDGPTDQGCIDQTFAYKLKGSLGKRKYLKQTIEAQDIHITIGDTLILSAWAKASSYPLGSSTRFEIRADVHYDDNTTETISASYDYEYTGWQYAALPIRVNKEKTLEYVQIYLDYSYNRGDCLFDNVRMVNTLATASTFEKDLSESITVFVKQQIIKERVTQYDGIYTTVIEKNVKYDVIRQTVTDQDGNSFASITEYDSCHRPIRTQNYRGIIAESSYNERGMSTLSKSYYYPTFNPDVTSPTFTIPEKCFMGETTYDSTGEFAVSASNQRDENIKTRSDYNAIKGLLSSTVDPNGQSTEYEYDTENDLVTKVSATVGSNEYSVIYGYTDRKLTNITHNGFNYGFTYDGMGRAQKVQIAGVDYSENSYLLNETTTVTTEYAGGEKMTVETDRHSQPVKRIYTDKLGNSTIIAEGEYDSLGKPVEVVDNPANKRYNYAYDAVDNVTEEKVNDVTFKEYEYDNHNRLTKTTFHLGGEVQEYIPVYEKTATDAIYADNAVVGVTLDGVFTARVEKDEYGRITEKKLTPSGETTPLLSDELTYIQNGARLTNMVNSLTQRLNGVTQGTFGYTYDNNGNITEIRKNGSLISEYYYDGMNQLVREDNYLLSKTFTFAYDTAGNITEKKEYAYTTGETLGIPTDTKIYTYATTGWRDQLLSYGNESFEYDALGNPTSYRGHALTWGKIRRLESFDSHNFTYNAAGIRTGKNNITYELDGSRILSETRYKPDSTETIYYYSVDGIIGSSTITRCTTTAITYMVTSRKYMMKLNRLSAFNGCCDRALNN